MNSLDELFYIEDPIRQRIIVITLTSEVKSGHLIVKNEEGDTRVDPTASGLIQVTVDDNDRLELHVPKSSLIELIQSMRDRDQKAYFNNYRGILSDDMVDLINRGTSNFRNFVVKEPFNSKSVESIRCSNYISGTLPGAKVALESTLNGCDIDNVDKVEFEVPTWDNNIWGNEYPSDMVDYNITYSDKPYILKGNRVTLKDISEDGFGHGITLPNDVEIRSNEFYVDSETDFFCKSLVFKSSFIQNKFSKLFSEGDVTIESGKVLASVIYSLNGTIDLSQVNCPDYLYHVTSNQKFWTLNLTKDSTNIRVSPRDSEVTYLELIKFNLVRLEGMNLLDPSKLTEIINNLINDYYYSVTPLSIQITGEKYRDNDGLNTFDGYRMITDKLFQYMNNLLESYTRGNTSFMLKSTRILDLRSLQNGLIGSDHNYTGQYVNLYSALSKINSTGLQVGFTDSQGNNVHGRPPIFKIIDENDYPRDAEKYNYNGELYLITSREREANISNILGRKPIKLTTEGDGMYYHTVTGDELAEGYFSNESYISDLCSPKREVYKPSYIIGLNQELETGEYDLLCKFPNSYIDADEGGEIPFSSMQLQSGDTLVLDLDNLKLTINRANNG